MNGNKDIDVITEEFTWTEMEILSVCVCVCVLNPILGTSSVPITEKSDKTWGFEDIWGHPYLFFSLKLGKVFRHGYLSVIKAKVELKIIFQRVYYKQEAQQTSMKLRCV